MAQAGGTDPAGLPAALALVEGLLALALADGDFDDLEREVWSGRVVNDDAVTNNIGKLSKALPGAPVVLTSATEQIGRDALWALLWPLLTAAERSEVKAVVTWSSVATRQGAAA